MPHTRLFALAFASLAGVSVAACGDEPVDVGTTQEQALKKKLDGSSSGNGKTCSFDDVVWYDAESGASGTIPSASGDYQVGDTFESPDGCNDCRCTTSGIMCTMRACSSPPGGGTGGGGACTEEAKLCPDGSYVSRTGPSCEFAPCPAAPIACPADAKLCPDGTYVSRTAPSCEFAPCPAGPIACTTDAKLCPDGTYVSRTAPSCEFAPCP